MEFTLKLRYVRIFIFCIYACLEMPRSVSICLLILRIKLFLCDSKTRCIVSSLQDGENHRSFEVVPTFTSLAYTATVCL